MFNRLSAGSQATSGSGDTTCQRPDAVDCRGETLVERYQYNATTESCEAFQTCQEDDYFDTKEECSEICLGRHLVTLDGRFDTYVYFRPRTLPGIDSHCQRRLAERATVFGVLRMLWSTVYLSEGLLLACRFLYTGLP